MSSFGSNIAGTARFLLEAETGQFNRDVTESEQKWSRTVANMSSDTLRLEASQDKLRRTIARYGPDSRQAKLATIELRRAQEQLGREAVTTERKMESARRSTLGLSSSMKLAAVSIIGGAGFTQALRKSVEAAKEAEQVQVALQNAIKRAGLSYADFRGQINRTIEAQSKLSSFDDEDLARSFTNLVRRTKDVSEALKLNALAANVARGRNIDLASASTIVLKAYNGQVGGLRRLGIAIDKNATSTQAIAKLQQVYGQAAAAYAETAAGKQERFNKVLGDSEEIIGKALLPAISGVAEKLGEWLQKQNESGELQKKINDLVEDGTKVVHGIADAFSVAKKAVGPLIDALGGIDRAVQTFLILGALAKLRTFIGGFALMRSASAITRTAVTADMAAIGAASAGVGVPGGKGGSRRGIPAIIPTGRSIVGNVATTAAVIGGINLVGDILKGPPDPQVQRQIYETAQYAPDAALTYARNNGYPKMTLAQIQSLKGVPFSVNLVRNAATPTKPFDFNLTTASARFPRKSLSELTKKGMSPFGVPMAPTPGRSDQDYRTDLARAMSTPSTGDEQALYARRLRYVRGVIGRIEGGGTLTQKQKQRLELLYNERNSLQSSIDSITQARADEAKQNAADAARAIREQLSTRETNLQTAVTSATGSAQRIAKQDALVEFYKQQAKNAKLTENERAKYAKKAAEAEKAGFDRIAADAKKAGKKYAEWGNAIGYLYSSAALQEKGAYKKITDAQLKAAGLVPKNSKKTQAAGMDPFARALDIYRSFSGNIRQFGQFMPLSPQEQLFNVARGALSANGVTVVQNFNANTPAFRAARDARAAIGALFG